MHFLFVNQILIKSNRQTNYKKLIFTTKYPFRLVNQPEFTKIISFQTC